MVLVYCTKVTSRLKYTLNLIFGTLLGVEWDLTISPEVFSGFEGAKVNYSKASLSGKEVLINPSGFIEKRGVQPFEPVLVRKGELPCLFPCKGTDDDFGFDLFAASFYLVSRYEEYLPHEKDRHGRFQAEESFAFRHGFLEVPVVNHYAIMLQKALQEKFPGLVFPARNYSFVPTYDIDIAYAYRGRGFFRGAGAAMRSLLQLNFSAIRERLQVLSGKAADPFDTYDLQLAWHRKYGLRAFYFFLCAEYGLFDRNISVFSTVFQNLVKKISDYAYTGIHPSYASGEDLEKLSTEVARLSKILNREVHFSRQHFLKMRMPETYRNLIRSNIDHDFTMGYASQTGFRASIASPFFFYDLGREEATSLKIFPFAVMDGTLKDYLNLEPGQAIQRIAKLVEAVRAVDGTFISLWHNEPLCECGKWEGWRHVYEQLLEMAAKPPLHS
ncbi:MAG: polysaccharide deacetylase family protein [Bacteroidales bacterium]|nr:polysaccharide deacetylase family protein [Bacteroidales bacterium]